MGMTYVCERCGTSLHGVNSHVCQIPLVESFNIHQDCLDEKTLREQIARGILAKCKNEKETNTSEFGSYEVSGCLEFIQLEDTAYYEVTCTHAEDAAIARGE